MGGGKKKIALQLQRRRAPDGFDDEDGAEVDDDDVRGTPVS